MAQTNRWHNKTSIKAILSIASSLVKHTVFLFASQKPLIKQARTLSPRTWNVKEVQFLETFTKGHIQIPKFHQKDSLESQNTEVYLRFPFQEATCHDLENPKMVTFDIEIMRISVISRALPKHWKTSGNREA